jgi:3'-5' exonuclease
MLDNVRLNNILFLDIETVPMYPSYEAVPESFRRLWDKKAERLNHPSSEPQTPGELYSRAGIYAEFGKVVCISAGIVVENNIRIKSFYGHDEYELLTDFADLLSQRFSGPDHYLCAHNGKEFDFPYLCRRMLVQGIRLPLPLQIAGMKPWEIRHLDTMELWKFGDYKNYTSLELLTSLFDIPTPKDDIDGSAVAGVYHQEHNLQRIVEYCQKDVVSIIQLFRCYQGMELIPAEHIFCAPVEG